MFMSPAGRLLRGSSFAACEFLAVFLRRNDLILGRFLEAASPILHTVPLISAKAISMNITHNAVVAFHYTVKDEDGVKLDSSEGGTPLTYLHGANNIIPGLERALEGKSKGDSLDVNIPPAEAYGEYIDALVESVPREAFQGAEVEVGMRFEAQTNNGPISVVITHIEGDQVTVDGNHPLAGQRLTFEVKVADIRDASEDELAHGHIHGEGGVHH